MGILKWGITVTVFFSTALCLVGQNTGTGEAVSKQTGGNTAPLELPNFVIERVEELNMTIGAKQVPKPPLAIPADYLDSLNSFEKQQIVPLKAETFPNKNLDLSFRRGFLKGYFGRFLTLDFEGGYGVNINGYDLNANAGFEAASGHIEGADYDKAFFKFSSDYIAPEKYLIFGGSRTRTAVEYKHSGYNLYSVKEEDFKNNSGLYERNSDFLNMNVISEGNYKSFSFHTGAGYKTLQLSSEKMNGHQNSFNGFIKVHNYYKKYLFATNLQLDLNNISTKGANFAQVDMSAKYFNDKFSININGGFQYAVSTKNIDRGGLLLAGDIAYRIKDDFTLAAKIKSGLTQKSFNEIYNENPYVKMISDVDFAYDIINLSLSSTYHPTDKIGLNLSFGFRKTNDFQFYTDSDNGIFEVNYGNITGISLFSEIWWDITDKDKVTANMIFNSISLDEKSTLPYAPIVKINASYSRLILENLYGNIGIIFASKKYGDIDNEVEIDGFGDLNLGFEYKLPSRISIYINTNNLLNSNITIWNGYVEKGLFASAGLMWHF